MQSYQDKSVDYFAHARTEIAAWLPECCPRVLELGCGAGATLGWLKQTGRASEAVGIEVAESAALAAGAHADQVWRLDIERDPWPALGPPFDCVLCLDVLEHLVNPWGVLDRLVRDQLAVGGTLLVSLPNVRHYSVLLPLVFGGRWDYAEAGLLDRTHLRFFTSRSASVLLQHPQLSPPAYHATGFAGWTAKNLFNRLSLGLLSEFVTYQHYLVARKLG